MLRFDSDFFDEYVMVAPGSDYGIAMWSDLKKVDNLTFLDYVINPRSKVISLLHHIHFSFSLNKAFSLPGQGLWAGSYALDKLPIDSEKKYCIIFTDISACRTGLDYLVNLHTRCNIATVLVMVNIMAGKKRLLDERLSSFDAVFSFDRADCDKYGFTYHPTTYSVPDTVANDSVRTDAFFIGTDKGGRHEKAKHLYQEIAKLGGTAEIYLAGVRHRANRINGIHYNERISYAEVLLKSMSTNCIVEIMGGGQTGLTLRAMEAICLNKRLLTDNQSAKELPYYETGFIRCVDEFGLEEAAFAMKRDMVDYHYSGDFSPTHLLEHIDEAMSASRAS